MGETSVYDDAEGRRHAPVTGRDATDVQADRAGLARVAAASRGLVAPTRTLGAMIGLQRTVGNAAVAALLRRPAPTTVVQRDAAADEQARIAKLEADYAAAVAVPNWSQAAVLLNGYNDDDILRKSALLTAEQRVALRAAADTQKITRLLPLIDAAVGTGVAGQAGERVGANDYVVQGAYRWKLDPDAISVEVDMDFKPDEGVTVPTAAWFGFITDTWNHYSAVNKEVPTEKKKIEFKPVAAAGHTINVHNGDGRANAANYFVGDTRAAQSVPHEFGHLVGLQDEYERDAGDFEKVTGNAALPATGGPNDASNKDKAAPMVVDINHALYLPALANETPDALARRRMAAVDQTLTGYGVATDYQRAENSLTHAVAARYLEVYKKELSQAAMEQVPGASNTDFGQWREKVIGSFEYTSTSIMGDMTADHLHSVEPRHVREFADHVQKAVGHGTWAPEQDH